MKIELPEELKVKLSIPPSAKEWHDRKQQAFLEAQAEKYLEAQTEKYDEAQAEK